MKFFDVWGIVAGIVGFFFLKAIYNHNTITPNGTDVSEFVMFVGLLAWWFSGYLIGGVNTDLS